MFVERKFFVRPRDTVEEVRQHRYGAEYPHVHVTPASIANVNVADGEDRWVEEGLVPGDG